ASWRRWRARRHAELIREARVVRPAGFSRALAGERVEARASRRRGAACWRAELVRAQTSGCRRARLPGARARDRVEAAARRDARSVVQPAGARLATQTVVAVGRPVAAADRRHDVRAGLRPAHANPAGLRARPGPT